MDEIGDAVLSQTACSKAGRPGGDIDALVQAILMEQENEVVEKRRMLDSLRQDGRLLTDSRNFVEFPGDNGSRGRASNKSKRVSISTQGFKQNELSGG